LNSDIYDLSDTSDIPFNTEGNLNAVDRCVLLLDGYDKPATVRDLKIFYWRMFGIEIEQKQLLNALAKAFDRGLIYRVHKRGVYCNPQVKKEFDLERAKK